MQVKQSKRSDCVLLLVEFHINEQWNNPQIRHEKERWSKTKWDKKDNKGKMEDGKS